MLRLEVSGAVRPRIRVVRLQRAKLRILWYNVDRDRAVGIATSYELDGPGIKPRWGRDFPHSSRMILGLRQPSVQWVPGLFIGSKAA